MDLLELIVKKKNGILYVCAHKKDTVFAVMAHLERVHQQLHVAINNLHMNTIQPDLDQTQNVIYQTGPFLASK